MTRQLFLNAFKEDGEREMTGNQENGWVFCAGRIEKDDNKDEG